MPSRLVVAVIALFWLATTGFVVRRDVLPRYFSDGPPPVTIELTDEATAQIPAKWSLYWDRPGGTKKVGGASTVLEYEPADDSFWFRSEYRDLKFDLAGFLIELPGVESDVRVSRAGVLREQRFAGDIRLGKLLALPVPGEPPLQLPLANASVRVTGKVEGGLLGGRCEVWTPQLPRFADRWARIDIPTVVDRPLDPVPVPEGQVLNPMMPLSRVRGVRPGRTWVVREVNPLAEAVAAMLQDAAKKANVAMLGGMAGRPSGGLRFVARVRSSPEESCWVIDYDGGEGVRAVTWVGVADGTVRRQEAAWFGETMRFERDY